MRHPNGFIGIQLFGPGTCACFPLKGEEAGVVEPPEGDRAEEQVGQSQIHLGETVPVCGGQPQLGVGLAS